MAKKQQQIDRAKLPKVGCEACGDGNGLLMVVKANGDREAKSCACLVRYRQAKAGLMPAAPMHDAKRKAAGE